MGELKLDCPHCHTKQVSFSSFGEFKKVRLEEFTVGFYCANCNSGIIAEYVYKGGETPHSFKTNLSLQDHLSFKTSYPIELATQAPKYLPDNIANFYLQAANSLNGKNYDASSMMSRKVLEVSVKLLNPNGKGSLYTRIEQLAEKNIITSELKDWAHIIRDDGNVAAHEENPITESFAIELLSFCEMFLMYTITMPNMIKAKRTDNQIIKEV